MAKNTDNLTQTRTVIEDHHRPRLNEERDRFNSRPLDQHTVLIDPFHSDRTSSKGMKVEYSRPVPEVMVMNSEWKLTD